MPRLSTVADRAATARRRAGRRAAAVVRDPCPLCGADLGGMHHTTRRKVVFSSVPGCFKWRCPDCSGVWEQGVVDRAADRAVDRASDQNVEKLVEKVVEHATSG